MVNKKGVGAAVAWVLLLGFSIALATTVFLWSTRQTEELSESAVRFVEGGMQCDNVMINVALINQADSEGKCNSDVCCLKISNTRYLNIEKLILRSLDPPEVYEHNNQLNVKTYATIDRSSWYGPVEVMPVVKVNGDFVACKNKAITVQC